jgi:hypothetical protein
MMKFKTLFLLLLILFANAVKAQEDNSMNAVIKGYERGYFQEVIDIAERALKDTAELSQEEIIYLKTYLAFSLVAMGQDSQASEKFIQILYAKPKLELNPEFVSPKIIEVFKKAQIEYFRLTGKDEQKTNFLFEKGRPGKFQGIWRSSIWPGWGQSIRGEYKKGKILKWASVSIAGTTGLSMLGTYINHQRYLDAVDPDDIQAKYRTYNNWYKARNFTVNLTVSFWIYNIVDIFLSN